MKFHIICEGGTDNEILEKLIKIIIKKNIEFIEPSNTQRKNRGVSSITKASILHKFLHYSFQNKADYIIICRDNDECKISEDGVPNNYYELLSSYNRFYQKYCDSYCHNPINVIVIPIQTIDYWMLAGVRNDHNPVNIRQIEKLPKQGIKEKVYGESNINPIGAPYESTFQNKLEIAITENTVNNVLIHLPSFKEFYKTISSSAIDLKAGNTTQV